MRNEKTLMFDQEVWCTGWSQDPPGYITVGPCKMIGVELDADGLRGVDSLIVSGASHSHFNSDSVFGSKQEADDYTAHQEGRRQRRLKLMADGRTPLGKLSVPVEHDKGESRYRAEGA